MNSYSVYVHTNRANGFRYVGITSRRPEERWQGGHGYRKQTVFWNAIVKYGWDNFDHEVVATGLTAADAWEMEKALIAKYNSTDRNCGYNRSTGGEAGAKGAERSETNKKACSAKLKELWQDEDFRRKRIIRTIEMNKSEAMREKRSESNKGRKLSEEARRKISEKNKGRKLAPFTEEHKRRMKENHAGGADCRAVECVEMMKVYKSINDASRALGINKKGISACCRGVNHYNTAGGYHWRFADSKEIEDVSI